MHLHHCHSTPTRRYAACLGATTPTILFVQAGTSGKSSVSTVYTLRLSTSWDRGSAMTEPMAGVQVCLVGKQGTAVLHRIAPVNDPKDRLTVMRDICSSVSRRRTRMTCGWCGLWVSLSRAHLPSVPLLGIRRWWPQPARAAHCTGEQPANR